jgi:hypothetical protein
VQNLESNSSFKLLEYGKPDIITCVVFFPNHISTHNSLLGCASQIVNGFQPMLKHFTYNRGIELLLPTGRYEDNGHPKLINKPCIIIIDIF